MHIPTDVLPQCEELPAQFNSSRLRESNALRATIYFFFSSHFLSSPISPSPCPSCPRPPNPLPWRGVDLPLDRTGSPATVSLTLCSAIAIYFLLFLFFLFFFFSDGDGSGAVLWRRLGAWWRNAALALGGTLALFHSFSFFKKQVRAAQIPFSLDGGDIIYIVGFYCGRTERGMEQNVLTDG
ncbi:hypothetical protein I7I53_06099 [Histoplasma capsulatum var. duboisii H88]|uniref:Uncharacterized protein n=1 Tax=Ajellomyces capsulatus (strain H88) TaxID=544711 RepID=A0A8A1LG06_AJEC8|nr:hypothetical protein I7I53_06099 [Histoplasma capsulatum var. duboisii H88]